MIAQKRLKSVVNEHHIILGINQILVRNSDIFQPSHDVIEESSGPSSAQGPAVRAVEDVLALTYLFAEVSVGAAIIKHDESMRVILSKIPNLLAKRRFVLVC